MVVVGTCVIDASENELELWFSPQDSFEVSLQLPSGNGPRPSAHGIYREPTAKRRKLLSVYNEVHHPSNGANYVAIYLSPNLKADPLIGVLAGTWTVPAPWRRLRVAISMAGSNATILNVSGRSATERPGLSFVLHEALDRR
jgi:hypothetical protein